MIARSAILVLVCGALGFSLDREGARGTFDPINRRSLEWFQTGCQGRPVSSNVVLIELRDGDLDIARRTFDHWPLAPLDYALLFECLARRQPEAVAIEPVLAWPELSALDIATLGERVTLLPHGVLACILHQAQDWEDVAPANEAGLPELGAIEGDLAMVPAFSKVLIAPELEVRGPRPLGFSRIDMGESLSRDGTSVLLPMIARRGAAVVPSLVLQALMSWKRVPPDKVKVRTGRDIEVGPQLRLPIDAAGRLRIYTGVPANVRRLEASVLLLDLIEDEKLLHHDAASLNALKSISGAVVVVGDTTAGAPGIALPRGLRWSLAEAIAQAIARAQSGQHVREVSPTAQRTVWAAIALLGLLQLRLAGFWIPGVTLGILLGLMAFSLLGFQLAHWWMPPVEPVLMALAAMTVSLLLVHSRSGGFRAPN
jgi:CHASE2 domain